MPVAGCRRIEYVGNFASVGVKQSVNEALERVKTLMECLGLPTHEEEGASCHAELLRWELRGSHSLIRPTMRRVWKIQLAVCFFRKTIVVLLQKPSGGSSVT